MQSCTGRDIKFLWCSDVVKVLNSVWFLGMWIIGVHCSHKSTSFCLSLKSLKTFNRYFTDIFDGNNGVYLVICRQMSLSVLMYGRHPRWHWFVIWYFGYKYKWYYLHRTFFVAQAIWYSNNLTRCNLRIIVLVI